MSDETQCWSCGKQVDSNFSECPNCGISLSKEEQQDDLDFLDSLIETTSAAKSDENIEETSNDEFDFVIPDMDYVTGEKEETSSPKGEFDEGYGKEEQDDEFDFVIPDMDYVSGAKEETSSPKGEFDTSDEKIETLNESEEKSTNLSTDKKSELLADMDSLLADPIETSSTKIEDQDSPQIEFSSDIDDLLETSNDEPEEQIEEVSQDISNSLFSIGFKKLVWLFSSQSFYWLFVYVIIVFASFEVTNPNLNPLNISDQDFSITAFGFLFAWFAFFVMGWFYSYKLRSYGISPNYKHATIYLFWMILGIYILSYILIAIYNPGLAEPIDYLLGTYFLIIPQHYLVTFLTAGWFFFVLGYRILWEQIYKISPMHDINPSLSEL